MSFDALVLDASLRQSLVAVRSLGRRGLRVAAAGRHHKTPALSSRWCRQGVVLPPEDAPGPYLADLEAWLEHAGARVLIASSDATIALLRASRARLEPRVRLALGNEDALAIAVDKERTLETARRLGIPAPLGVVVTEVGGVPLALNKVGLPAVVKPSASWLWNGREGLRLGATLVATPAEAFHAVATVTRFGGAALIQQLLTGRREAVSFLYARGEVYARFAQWAMRTDPPLGGLSVLRQSIAVPPDIGPQAEALVRVPRAEGSFMKTGYAVGVVGAGPYGLSTAAHLLGQGLRVAVFGRTLEMWREHMPGGMLLRSHWWATNLSDPRHAYGFARFFAESQWDRVYPLPIEAFIDYGCWFQQRAVPQVEETYVASVEYRNGRFLLTLEDGREVESGAVVMAVGLYYYANRPEPYASIPDGLVSHSFEHRDFRRFAGRDVIVIGGGQSGVEFAALLHEAGAAVQVVSRRPINWLPPDRTETRGALARLLAPAAGIAPGWVNWVWDHRPYLFYRFPQSWKDRYNASYPPGANDWLRTRVLGKIALHEGRTVANVDVANGRVAATLSDGARLSADHVLLATGYRVNVNRLPMLHPSLRAELMTDGANPILNHWL